MRRVIRAGIIFCHFFPPDGSSGRLMPYGNTRAMADAIETERPEQCRGGGFRPEYLVEQFRNLYLNSSQNSKLLTKRYFYFFNHLPVSERFPDNAVCSGFRCQPGKFLFVFR